VLLKKLLILDAVGGVKICLLCGLPFVLLLVKEINYKQQLASELYKHGIFYVQASFSIVRGIPDILFFKDGDFFAIELKMPNGVLSKLQADRLVTIVKNLGYSFIVTLDNGFKSVTVVRVNDRKVTKMVDFKSHFPQNIINWRNDGRPDKAADSIAASDS
jgi:hypothetical protein